MPTRFPHSLRLSVRYASYNSTRRFPFFYYLTNKGLVKYEVTGGSKILPRGTEFVLDNQGRLIPQGKFFVTVPCIIGNLAAGADDYTVGNLLGGSEALTSTVQVNYKITLPTLQYRCKVRELSEDFFSTDPIRSSGTLKAGIDAWNNELLLGRPENIVNGVNEGGNGTLSQDFVDRYTLSLGQFAAFDARTQNEFENLRTIVRDFSIPDSRILDREERRFATPLIPPETVFEPAIGIAFPKRLFAGDLAATFTRGIDPTRIVGEAEGLNTTIGNFAGRLKVAKTTDHTTELTMSINSNYLP